jgi:hypothetical protein
VVVPTFEVSYNDFGDNERPLDAVSLEYDDEWEVMDVFPFMKETTLPDNWWEARRADSPPASSGPTPTTLRRRGAHRYGLAGGASAQDRSLHRLTIRQTAHSAK